MIAFIFGCAILGILLGIPYGAIKQRKLSKRDREITKVIVKGVNGNKYSFEVYYSNGDVLHEAQMSWSERGKMLLGHVKD